MLTDEEIQRERTPKQRIGRARFLLEFIVAMGIMKTSQSVAIVPTLVLGVTLLVAIWINAKRLRDISRGKWWVLLLIGLVVLVFIYGLICVLSGVPRPDDTIHTNMMPMVIVETAIPLLVLSIGCFLTILASVKRLRDIKQSEWWAAIVISPVIVGAILGASIKLGSQLTTSAYYEPIFIVGSVVYLLCVGVLLFKPSASRKNDLYAFMTATQLKAKESDTATGASRANIEETLHVSRQVVPRMNRLNGWQRIGVLLSALWCLGVVGIATAKYFDYSYKGISSERRTVPCPEKSAGEPESDQAKPGCRRLLSDWEALGYQSEAVRPSVTPFLALLFLPIAAGWIIVYLTLRIARWVREGFKLK